MMKTNAKILAGIAALTLLSSPVLAQSTSPIDNNSPTADLPAKGPHHGRVLSSDDATDMVVPTDRTLVGQYVGGTVMSSDAQVLGVVKDVRQDTGGATWASVNLDDALGADVDTAMVAMNSLPDSNGTITVNMSRDEFVAAVDAPH